MCQYTESILILFFFLFYNLKYFILFIYPNLKWLIQKEKFNW